MAEAPPSATDHLVLAVPSLKDGIRNIAGLLGITPAVGGKHPQWRTQNAIVSLGPRVYLEVMGPDDQPADPTKPRPFGMDQLASPKLVTWAVRSDDLQQTVLTARSAGINLGEVLSGSRKRPDGVLLQWQMTDLTKDRENGVVPFFISWARRRRIRRRLHLKDAPLRDFEFFIPILFALLTYLRSWESSSLLIVV